MTVKPMDGFGVSQVAQGHRLPYYDTYTLFFVTRVR